MKIIKKGLVIILFMMIILMLSINSNEGYNDVDDEKVKKQTKKNNLKKTMEEK